MTFNSKFQPPASQQGYTLVELMVVVAIVAIIAGIALPAYQSQMAKTRTTDGQTIVTRIMQAQERYFTENLTYVTDLTTLGLAANPAISDEGYYQVAAATCGVDVDGDGDSDEINECVLLTATPVAGGAQDGEPNLTLNSIGTRSW